MARFWSLTMMVMMVMALTMGCRAEDEVKQGAEGEFCADVVDACRLGLTCVDGICQNTGSNLEYDCTDVCETLRACGSNDDTCIQACREAVTDWSDRAIESFGQCFAEEITCEMADDDPQQFCYDQIEIPDDRSARCSLFAETVRSCQADVDTEDLRKACFRTGRVGTDAAWAETQRCADAVDTGICSGIGSCLNDVFGTSFNLPDTSL